MKKILMLFISILFLAACGAAEPTAPGLIDAGSETAVSPTSPSSPTDEPETADSLSSNTTENAGFPATNPAEASIIRDTDWVKGAADPVVSIIEYGDFQ